MTAKKFDWDSIRLDFGNWEEEKLWALELPVVDLNIQELLWHFDVPFWTNDSSERWMVTPWEVIDKKEGTMNEQNSIDSADLTYPIDIFENRGKWLVLDGLHRLTKAYIQKQDVVRVRIIPRDRLPDIASEYPIELPHFDEEQGKEGR